MLKNDFLLKQIQEYLQFLLRLLFPKGNVATERKRMTQTPLFLHLSRLVDEGCFNEAEDALFEAAEEGAADLSVGIFFYERLLQIPEKELRAHEFSTKEIETGLKDYTKQFDIEF